MRKNIGTLAEPSIYLALQENNKNPIPNCKIAKANFIGVLGFIFIFDIVCRVLIDYWCSRPERQDKKGRYSAKRSREQLYELDNFFTHTHVSTDFAWRKPEDFDLLNRKVAKDKSKESVSVITHKLVPVADLKKLMTQGSVIQRLIATWCINCSHGAGEIGRVQWGDLFLNQDHPWKSQGLQVESGGNWVGFLRNKSSVVGWLVWSGQINYQR